MQTRCPGFSVEANSRAKAAFSGDNANDISKY
jgi:hypothetical protein